MIIKFNQGQFPQYWSDNKDLTFMEHFHGFDICSFFSCDTQWYAAYNLDGCQFVEKDKACIQDRIILSKSLV
jgi:hypothetical protein